MSNVTTATTLNAPVISCAPDSFAYSMLSNNTKNDSLIIANTSINASTLKFTVETANSTFPEKVLQLNITAQNDFTEKFSGTKENPIENGGISIKGSADRIVLVLNGLTAMHPAVLLTNGTRFDNRTEATNWMQQALNSQKMKDILQLIWV
jgi:hypothetical protein